MKAVGEGFMTDATMVRPIEILLVEDSPTDAFLTREAFNRSKLLNKMHVVDNGDAAIAYLRGQGSEAPQARPDLILLDLNLPKKDGKEVLKEIKADDELKTIPVVVLTSSKDEEDVLRSYKLHANCYITKPVEFQKLAEVVKCLRDFWFSVVTLPNLIYRQPE